MEHVALNLNRFPAFSRTISRASQSFAFEGLKCIEITREASYATAT